MQRNYFNPVIGTGKIQGDFLLPGEDGVVVTSDNDEGAESYKKLTGNIAWGLIDMKDGSLKM